MKSQAQSEALRILRRAIPLLLVPACSLYGQQQSKPHKHAMPIPGMQMGHESHTPVSQLRLSLQTAWNRADITTLASLFNESAVLILPTGKLVTGRQSIKEFLQQHVHDNVRASFNSIGFDPSPELQVEFGTFSESKASSSNEHSEGEGIEGKYVMIVKRFGSDWKIQEIVFVTPSQSL